jgi:uncharacterized NAD-dependent epimerase/dehydratase family protein
MSANLILLAVLVVLNVVNTVVNFKNMKHNRKREECADKEASMRLQVFDKLAAVI